jgi:hypothetical protein
MNLLQILGGVNTREWEVRLSTGVELKLSNEIVDGMKEADEFQSKLPAQCKAMFEFKGRKAG